MTFDSSYTIDCISVLGRVLSCMDVVILQYILILYLFPFFWLRRYFKPYFYSPSPSTTLPRYGFHRKGMVPLNLHVTPRKNGSRDLWLILFLCVLLYKLLVSRPGLKRVRGIFLYPKDSTFDGRVKHYYCRTTSSSNQFDIPETLSRSLSIPSFPVGSWDPIFGSVSPFHRGRILTFGTPSSSRSKPNRNKSHVYKQRTLKSTLPLVQKTYST